MCFFNQVEPEGAFARDQNDPIMMAWLDTHFFGLLNLKLTRTWAGFG